MYAGFEMVRIEVKTLRKVPNTLTCLIETLFSTGHQELRLIFLMIVVCLRTEAKYHRKTINRCFELLMRKIQFSQQKVTRHSLRTYLQRLHQNILYFVEWAATLVYDALG